jgi:hypothetical protein
MLVGRAIMARHWWLQLACLVACLCWIALLVPFYGWVRIPVEEAQDLRGDWRSGIIMAAWVVAVAAGPLMAWLSTRNDFSLPSVAIFLLTFATVFLALCSVLMLGAKAMLHGLAWMLQGDDFYPTVRGLPWVLAVPAFGFAAALLVFRRYVVHPLNLHWGLHWYARRNRGALTAERAQASDGPGAGLA